MDCRSCCNNTGVANPYFEVSIRFLHVASATCPTRDGFYYAQNRNQYQIQTIGSDKSSGNRAFELSEFVMQESVLEFQT